MLSILQVEAFFRALAYYLAFCIRVESGQGFQQGFGSPAPIEKVEKYAEHTQRIQM